MKRYIKRMTTKLILFSILILVYIIMIAVCGNKPFNELSTLTNVTMGILTVFIFIVVIPVSILDINICSSYYRYSQTGKEKVVVLSFSQFMKFYAIAPNKYVLHWNNAYYFHEGIINVYLNEITVNTIIYFDSDLSFLRYTLFRWRHKMNCDTPQMGKYMEMVKTDIEEYNKSFESKLKKVNTDYKIHLSLGTDESTSGGTT